MEKSNNPDITNNFKRLKDITNKAESVALSDDFNAKEQFKSLMKDYALVAEVISDSL